MGPRPEIKDVSGFYRALFRPVEERIGKVDPKTLVALIGFQAGGPPNLSVVKAPGFVTYVTCELACYEEQVPSDDRGGPFEVLVSANDEGWARSVATAIGRISFDAALGPGHTVDLGPFAEKKDKLQGVVLERFSTCTYRRRRYGILRTIGITRPEMEWAQEHSGQELLEKLRAAGVYPNSDVRRRSVKL
jgi:suppressor of fused protein SUFU